MIMSTFIKDWFMHESEAFEKIYRATYKSMFAAAIAGAGKIEDAEDILQNVYSAFYRRTLSKGFPDTEGARLILKKALKHELYRFYGRAKRSPVFIDDCEDSNAQGYLSFMDEDIPDRVAAAITAGKVWEEIKKRGDLTVRIFILRFRLELSLREISEVLEISEATVTNRLYRTAKELKSLFETDNT
jgi:RNA polymerase sigma-70 factor (ECF subfamily)